MRSSDYEILEGLISCLDNPIHQEILLKRFGLLEYQKKTLNDLSLEYKISRERVRQIEKSSISLIKSSQGYFSYQKKIKFSQKFFFSGNDILFENEINQSDVNLNSFLDEFLEEKGFFLNQTNFREKVWFREKQISEQFSFLLDEISELKGDIFLREDYILQELEKKIQIKKNKLQKLLYNSKKIHTDKKTGFLTFDKSSKKVSDYLYFYLKTKNQATHYKQIVKDLKEDLNLDINLGTCHNELIRDNRFILVGRGYYALNNSRYSGLEIKELIKQILLKHKRLKASSIIEKVLEKKVVKNNSIHTVLYSKSFNKDKNGFFYLK